MPDLRTQLRTYVEATIERIDSDDIAAAVSGAPLVEHRTTWPTRPPLVAALSAIAVLVFIGGTAWLVGDRATPTADPSPVAVTGPVAVTTPEFPPPAEAETPVTAPTPAAPLLNWMRVPDQEAFADAAILAVTAGGPGFVAVGVAAEEPPRVDDRDFHFDAAVWVSTDGVTWDRIDDPSFTGRADVCGSLDGYQSMVDVAAGPLGIIAVGRDGCNSAVWISQDGRTWTEVIDDEWRSNPVAVQGIAAGGPGWVAVGSDVNVDGVVWVSTDGMDWTAVQDDDLLATGVGRVEIYGVTAGGPGLVAVGKIGFEDAGARSAIWVSTDGLDWERLPDGTIGGKGLFRIEHDPKSGRLIAFSRPGAGEPGYVSWTSSDGINWIPSASLSPSAGSGVAWNGDRLVAGGGGRERGIFLWASTDGGTTWAEIGRDDPAFGISHLVRDVVSVGSRVVVVGYEPGVLSKAGWGEANGSTGAVWVGEWVEG